MALLQGDGAVLGIHEIAHKHPRGGGNLQVVACADGRNDHGGGDAEDGHHHQHLDKRKADATARGKSGARGRRFGGHDISSGHEKTPRSDKRRGIADQ